MNRATMVDLLKQSTETIGTIGKEEVDYSVLTRALRRLQALMHHTLLSNVKPETRLLAFFLNAYIQSIFTDLLGDIPDDLDNILAGVRYKFLTEVAKNLELMIQELEKEQFPQNALQGFVLSYTSAINDLNLNDIRLEGRR